MLWQFLRRVAKLAGLALLAKAAVSVAIQLRPTPTPPAVGFVLNSRARRRYRDPAGTLRRIGLRPGMRALELGPGVGLFTGEAARILNPSLDISNGDPRRDTKGHEEDRSIRVSSCDSADHSSRIGLLIALDLQMGMLRPLARTTRAAGLANVALGAAEAGALPLPDASIDLAFLFAVLPMLPDKRRALAELRRVLRPGGILVVGEDLIEPEYVPAFVIRRWCRRAGFAPRAAFGNGLCYTLVFTRP